MWPLWPLAHIQVRSRGAIMRPTITPVFQHVEVVLVPANRPAFQEQRCHLRSSPTATRAKSSCSICSSVVRCSTNRPRHGGGANVEKARADQGGYNRVGRKVS